ARARESGGGPSCTSCLWCAMRNVLFAAALVFLAAAPAQAVVVSVPNRTDQVFDDYRGLLYLSTSTGLVQRYNPVSNTLLPAWNVGTNITAIDVTPDNHYL